MNIYKFNDIEVKRILWAYDRPDFQSDCLVETKQGNILFWGAFVGAYYERPYYYREEAIERMNEYECNSSSE